LPELSILEQTVIALNIRYLRVFKLSGTGQQALQGHMIALPHNSPHVVAQQLPRTDISTCFRIAFVTDTERWSATLRDPVARRELFNRFHTVLSVNAANVFCWLQILRAVNPYYHDLTFRDNEAAGQALERLPEDLLNGALACTSEISRHVEAQTISRLDGEAAPIGAVFVAPPVRTDHSDVQILTTIRSAITGMTILHFDLLSLFLKEITQRNKLNL
jgi:hypothetical protein